MSRIIAVRKIRKISNIVLIHDNFNDNSHMIPVQEGRMISGITWDGSAGFIF